MANEKAPKKPKPDKAEKDLLKALRKEGRSKPIDAYEKAHGKVPPASRGGVATATAAALRDLMDDGYVVATYWEADPEAGVLYDLTDAGHAQAVAPDEPVTPEPTTPPGKDPKDPKPPKGGKG